MAKITISYRREDTMDITGRIFDRLVSRYGRDCVFRDIDSIPPGFDFREHIGASLADSDILMVVVGPNWIGRSANGQLRINSPTDYVRFEVETALRRKIPVIPLLVGASEMPLPSDLPDNITDFAYRNAVRIDSGRDFDHHMAGLMRAMDRILLAPAGEQAPNRQPLPDIAEQRTSGSGASHAPFETAQLATGPGRTDVSPPPPSSGRPGSARAKIELSTVGGVLVAQGILHVVWLVSNIASASDQLLQFVQHVWTFGDVIFGFGGIVIGIGTILGKDWARPSGASLCILGIITEVLMFIEYGDKEMPRLIIALNVLLLPLSVIGTYFFLFRWPEFAANQDGHGVPLVADKSRSE